MNCSVATQLLKDGLIELNDRRKISNALKTEADAYLDGLSSLDVREIEYSEFNQTDSVGFTFDNGTRSASNVGAGELLTNLTLLL